MRKLTTIIGLVVILALGLVAGVGRPQPARAATDESVVLAWNQQLLDTIKETRTGPTIAARALAVVHTAIYDAWAAYDPVAVDTRQRLRVVADLRQPTAERTVDNKTKAVSFAAYATLVDLFPARQATYAQQMADLDYVIHGSDTSTAAIVGAAAAQAVLVRAWLGDFASTGRVVGNCAPAIWPWPGPSPIRSVVSWRLNGRP